eukprot:UN01967
MDDTINHQSLTLLVLISRNQTPRKIPHSNFEKCITTFCLFFDTTNPL